ncbi:uncharacterized protein DEA37_0014444 [Paragonimus westermani]|uniref:Uncharacterized protein n=1 Tax=Paragonimus westermani TaxID=34504 RepID=A0A5J4NRT1_9TREM|nr:uncharacterized protein DEA37_0014444 [Paragonimus westermani]
MYNSLQIGQLRAQLDKKQKHAQTMLDEFIQTQGQLDISEKENIDLKSNLSRSEQRVNELSQELLISKERLDKTQQLLREAELIRSTAEHKVKQQDTDYHIRIEQYQTELEKATNQLIEERERSDLLVVQLERACHRSSAYASQVEELRSQLESVLTASTIHGEMSRRTNDQIEKLNLRITELENLVSVLDADKLKLKEAAANRISLTQLISSLKSEIKAKETDLSATKFQQNVVNDQVIQLENDKRLLVADHAKAMEQMQIRYSRAMNLLKRRTRSVLSNTGRHHQYLHRRLAHMKRTQQQLIRRLAIRSGQLQRLDQLLWETGWKYTQIKDQLECLAQRRADEVLQSMQPKSYQGETVKADATTEQLVSAKQKNPTTCKEL